MSPLPTVLIATALLSPAAAPQARLDILSPEAGAFVTGPVRVEVSIEAPAAVIRGVSFFVDGKLRCEVEAPPYACEFDAGREVRAHLIRVVAELDGRPRLVRNLVTGQRAESFSFRATTRAVLVPVGVTRDGRYVTELSRSSFRLFEDGRPQEIVSFSAREAPLELVVAVDASSSMEDHMATVKRAVESFMARLAPEDRLSLLAFNDEIYTLAGNDAGAAARSDALSKLEPFGNTSLYDAVASGFRLLDREAGKQAVVVFTDGQDNSSQLSLSEIEAVVESGSATLFIIATEDAIRDEALRDLLERLSERSGGRALFDEKLEDLERAFESVYREIRSQYLLGYAPENQSFEGKWRTIEVELTDDSLESRAREGYRVRTR